MVYSYSEVYLEVYVCYGWKSVVNGTITASVVDLTEYCCSDIIIIIIINNNIINNTTSSSKNSEHNNQQPPRPLPVSPPGYPRWCQTTQLLSANDKELALPRQPEADHQTLDHAFPLVSWWCAVGGRRPWNGLYMIIYIYIYLCIFIYIHEYGYDSLVEWLEFRHQKDIREHKWYYVFYKLHIYNVVSTSILTV